MAFCLVAMAWLFAPPAWATTQVRTVAKIVEIGIEQIDDQPYAVFIFQRSERGDPESQPPLVAGAPLDIFGQQLMAFARTASLRGGPLRVTLEEVEGGLFGPWRLTGMSYRP